MKIISLTFLVFLFSSITISLIFGQINLYVGTNYSKMNWTDKSDDNLTHNLIFPDTKFEIGYAIGMDVQVPLNNKFFFDGSAQYNEKRFSIATDGVVFAVDDQGQYIAIMADKIGYRVNQITLLFGVGCKIIDQLSLSVKPYFSYNPSDIQLRVGNVIPWRKAESFQYKTDFGLGGYVQYQINNFFLRTGVQYGIKNNISYGATDANGVPIGFFGVKNVAFELQFGYCLKDL